MERKLMRILALCVACVALASLALAFYYFASPPSPPSPPAQPQTLKVFHAGSLAVPFSEIEEEFEASHPGVDVQRESMGSAQAVRQVTDVGKRADVLAVADYSLIPQMMFPEHADFVVKFARNELVLAYTEKSRHSSAINESNWHEILRLPDVTFGFSNPNLDPCGYRALIAMQLAEIYYNDASIFDDLVCENTAITVSESENGFLVEVPAELKPNTRKVAVRDKSVALVAMLEQGGIDYAFEYRSVAVQHNLKFVDLPPQIDLSDEEYADFYGKVSVKTADGKVKRGKTIIYGITIPKNAPNPSLARSFVAFVLSEEGRKTLEECGQEPIVPAVGEGNVSALRAFGALVSLPRREE
ncbi:MAG: tungstate ABC transporter substrate-binding protein WtpA [Candidatus Methanospirare jalkutatii]|nr:MAG: tungstate ABC transporter substrate-binding protein WtpA [Candidatus Methanospirare jalkutatii]